VSFGNAFEAIVATVTVATFTDPDAAATAGHTLAWSRNRATGGAKPPRASSATRYRKSHAARVSALPTHATR